MNTTLSLKNSKLNKYLPWIMLIFSFLFIVALNYYVQWRCLDSDISSEMVLAKLLNEEGSFISKNWYYSTEVHILNEEMWFKFGLMLFPHNWRIARLVSHSFNLAILIGTFIFFLYSTSIKEKGIWIAIALLLPFDFWYLFHVVFGGAYINITVLIFVLLGLLLRYLNNHNKLYLILLFIAGIVFGINGIKILMYFTIPLIVAVVSIFVYKYIFNKNISIKYHLISCLTVFISTVIGVFIYLFIICKYYVCYPNFDHIWGQFNISNIVYVIGNYLQSLGFVNSDWFTTEIKIMSINGIFGVFGLINIIVFIISIVSLCRNKYFKVCNDKFLFIFIISAFFSGICIFSLTKEPQNGTYWIPLLPFSFVIIEMFLESIHAEGLNTKFIRCFMVLSLVFCSIANTSTYLKEQPRSYSGTLEATKLIMEKQYKNVIAEFWIANNIAEYSNGEIEAYVISNYDNNEIYKWLQRKDHTEVPKDNETCVVIADSKVNEWALKFYSENFELLGHINDLYIYTISE